MTIINESQVRLDTNYKSQIEVLEAISEIALKEKLSKEEIYSDLLKREEIYPTAMGFDISIPHAKTNKITKTSIVVIRNLEKVKWGDEEVKLMIGLLTSDEGGNEHLKILAGLSRKLIHEDFRQSLMDASTESEIVELIKKIEEEV